ncbi:M57 family metalloprotease [Aquimarina sp. RZ0]|uniref:M57 family metalloprotease n=1 Tax=Aquimarina sp. RZ0 TaxID=2607730 RepID=UPI0011F2E4F5|nr:M57 family metalloprotease [Aquimarina sp. RZ0]KAA1245183.1 hypothetical protein F0000_13100 [Aquimarina sp. RZ0]
MKSLKLITTSVLISATLFSCQKDDIETEQNSNQSEIITVSNNNVPEDVATKLRKLNFNPDFVTRKEITVSNGKVIKGWLADDIFISDKQISLLDETNNTERAYIRNTRVDPSIGVRRNGQRIIRVRIDNGSDSATGETNPILPNHRRALRAAVGALNNLNLNLRWEILGDNSTIFDVETSISIGNGPIDGFAGSMFNGNPGGFISASAPNNRQLRGVLIHEIMHSIGFRHSDFRTRNSCQNVNPRQVFDEGSDDANFVSGTVRDDNFMNSIMTACFIGNTSLSREDVNALRSIYRR